MVGGTSSESSRAGLTSRAKLCFCFRDSRLSGPAKANMDVEGHRGSCPQCIVRHRVEIALSGFRRASPAQRAPARAKLQRELNDLSAELHLWSAKPWS